MKRWEKLLALAEMNEELSPLFETFIKTGECQQLMFDMYCADCPLNRMTCFLGNTKEERLARRIRLLNEEVDE